MRGGIASEVRSVSGVKDDWVVWIGLEGAWCWIVEGSWGYRRVDVEARMRMYIYFGYLRTHELLCMYARLTLGMSLYGL